MQKASLKKSWTIQSSLEFTFHIRKSDNLFAPENKSILEFGLCDADSRRIIFIDRKIAHWYLKKITDYFDFHCIELHIVTIDASETDKNLDTLLLIIRELEKFGLLRRSEPIIGIGGGVLLDIVGLAASIYRRGVPYLKVPTTLIGLIDASVGAKTGINFDIRRNRLGTYYPPLAAYLDSTFLSTLPEIEISSGLGEVLKMAVIKDALLFNLLDNHAEDLLSNKNYLSEHATELISRSVEGMKVELENNLWESDLKRCVDFGHSFSPIIEMRSLEKNSFVPLTHGQAVALDVIFSSILSFQRKLLSSSELFKIINVAKRLGLPTNHDLFNDALFLLESLKDTMKHRNGNQYLPIPTSIGVNDFINDLTFEEIKSAANFMKSLN